MLFPTRRWKDDVELKILASKIFAICGVHAVLLVEDICRKLASFDILILAERKPSTWWRR